MGNDNQQRMRPASAPGPLEATYISEGGLAPGQFYDPKPPTLDLRRDLRIEANPLSTGFWNQTPHPQRSLDRNSPHDHRQITQSSLVFQNPIHRQYIRTEEEPQGNRYPLINQPRPRYRVQTARPNNPDQPGFEHTAQSTQAQFPRGRPGFIPARVFQDQSQPPARTVSH